MLNSRILALILFLSTRDCLGTAGVLLINATPETVRYGVSSHLYNHPATLDYIIQGYNPCIDLFGQHIADTYKYYDEVAVAYDIFYTMCTALLRHQQSSFNAHKIFMEKLNELKILADHGGYQESEIATQLEHTYHQERLTGKRLFHEHLFTFAQSCPKKPNLLELLSHLKYYYYYALDQENLLALLTVATGELLSRCCTLTGDTADKHLKALEKKLFSLTSFFKRPVHSDDEFVRLIAIANSGVQAAIQKKFTSMFADYQGDVVAIVTTPLASYPFVYYDTINIFPHEASENPFDYCYNIGVITRQNLSAHRCFTVSYEQHPNAHEIYLSAFHTDISMIKAECYKMRDEWKQDRKQISNEPCIFHQIQLFSDNARFLCASGPTL